MVTSRCLEPACFRVAQDGQTEAVSCCVGRYGGANNWRCTGTIWDHEFSAPNPRDKYTGIKHDDICKDIGRNVFSENTWSGIDNFKPFGELRKIEPVPRPSMFDLLEEARK